MMNSTRLRSALLAATVVTGLGLGMGTASAGPGEFPSTTSLVNGAVMLGCQYNDQALLAQCTDMEQLTTDDPAILAVNPVTTDIVILGAGLFPDGGIRDILDQRLRAGYRLATEYPTARIIVTGGAPRNGRTEAQAMSDWLVGAGIDPARITREDASGSTVQNAQFTDRIFRERGTTGAVVVTNDFHLKRAMLNFRQAVGGRIPVAGVVAN